MNLGPKPTDKEQLVNELEFIVRSEGDGTLSIEGS